MYKFWSSYEGLILINEDIRKNKIVINDNPLITQSLCFCVRVGELPIFNGEPLINCYEILNNTINS
jgi:hypothetical protein